MSRFKEAYRHIQGQGRVPESKPPERDIDHSLPVIDLSALPTATSQSQSSTLSPGRSVEPKRLELESQSLRDAGLLPPTEDEDHLRRQFRRIKRPVIDNAFDLGIPRNNNSNVVMVASALPGAGKSFVSMNLALSVSLERDIGVILVDADVLKPKCTDSLGLQKNPGLIDYLLSVSKDIESILVPTNIPGLRLIPAGSAHSNATELLASKRMRTMVEQLAADYSDCLIVVDTPPLLVTNEAQVLAQYMGQILLVVQEGASSQRSILDAVEMLDRSKPINVILNKARISPMGGYGNPYYGYAYSGPERSRYAAE